jgi:hypothetical protein
MLSKLLFRHGIKLALPLLFLTTACGEGGTSNSVSPTSSAPSSAPSTGATAVSPDNTFGGPAIEISAPNVPGVSVDDPGEGQKPDEDPGKSGEPEPIKNQNTTDIPEPLTAMGLAVTGLGAMVMNRKKRETLA